MPRMQINLPENVREVLEESAKRFGVSMSGYISQLIMRADVEFQMSKMLRAMDPEQLSKAIKEQQKEKGDGDAKAG